MRLAQQPYPFRIESHNVAAHYVHCDRIGTSDEKAAILRRGVERPLPVPPKDAVDHAQVRALGGMLQATLLVREADDHVEIQRRSPNGVVPPPISLAEIGLLSRRE